MIHEQFGGLALLAKSRRRNGNDVLGRGNLGEGILAGRVGRGFEVVPGSLFGQGHFAIGTSAPLESLMTPCSDVFAICEKPIAADPMTKNRNAGSCRKRRMRTTSEK